MSKIDISAWKSFVVADLFQIERPNARIATELDAGNIPFVASGNYNNGIEKYVDSAEELDRGNCITISPVDGSAFYQPNDFLGRGGAGSSIVILRSPRLNQYNGLFLCSILGKVCGKYNYSNMGSASKIKNEVVCLPCTKTGDPDWEYMESYIKDKISAYKSNIQILTAITPPLKIERINVGKWGSFVIGELFPKIIKPDVIHAKSVSENDGGLAYVVRSKFNNGIKCKVSPKPCYKPSPAGTISFGAENATFFYQPQEYISGRDIYYIDTRHLSKEVCLFLTTCLQTIAKRYSYNNGLFPDLLKKETIWLPITAEGKPDWNYMENTIRNLMHNSEQYIKAINYA